jgi:lipoprotein LprG
MIALGRVERYHRAMSPGRGRRRTGKVAALITFLGLLGALVACTGDRPASDLPAGPDVLDRAADAMRSVTSARISIDVDPAAAVVPIRSADGALTSTGEADGTAVLALMGSPPLEYRLIVTGGSLYLKGPTGGFNQLPLAATSGIYDPTAILDPERGTAELLATAQDAETQARETVDGVESYRVAATFRPERVSALVPGVTSPTPGVVWTDVATSRLVRAELELPPGPDGAAGGPVTVQLTRYNESVSIAAPS